MLDRNDAAEISLHPVHGTVPLVTEKKSGPNEITDGETSHVNMLRQAVVTIAGRLMMLVFLQSFQFLKET
jgi:hypothetical protein